MAVVKPFQGYFYAQETAQDRGIGKLVTPPYDVISEKEKRRLMEEEYNFVHIILGRDESGYQKAAQKLADWVARGIIRKDHKKCFYIYEQEFQMNGVYQSERKTRTGFISLVRLEEFEKKIIFPHERTMPKYSLDRLELLEATRANLEQIFGIYHDPKGVIDEILEGSKIPEQKLFEFVDHRQVTHRIFSLSDPEKIEQIRRAMNPRTIIIADGHHRYETCLNYRRKVRERLGDPLEEIPEDYTMMTLVSIQNPGLLILPTHRLVKNLPLERINGFFDRCQKYFHIHLFPNEKLMEEYLREAPPYTIGVYDKIEEEWGAITLKDPAIMDEKLGKENVNRYLDTAILHELVFKEILGLSDEDQGKSEYVDYLRGTKDVFAIAREENQYQLVFVMCPTPMEMVERAVVNMQRMPQKSTYFYPKVWSGLVIRFLE
ncbi:MAG: DUF1015 domain-containing protein [Candidatus Caldatribacteriaceae bacterium]